MASKMISKEYCVLEDSDICEFICDTETDVTNLQTEYPNCCAGSNALVVETGNVYMVNASGNWVKFGG